MGLFNLFKVKNMSQEIKEYLEKDAEYEWRFTNPLIKKQFRSLSFDMA